MEKVYYIYSMLFEWDERKSHQNLKKHGVSFEAAVSIWSTPFIEVDEVARTTKDEIRGATVGKIGHLLYVAIWTKRNNRTRIISVRRARDGEKEVYYKKSL